MKRAVLVLAALACATPALADPPPPIRSHGKLYALVSVQAHFSECSNAGGEHYLLAVTQPGARDPRTVHFGGHESYTALFAGDLFVAEIDARPRADEDHDGNPDSSVSGWCLSGIGKSGGEVTRLLEVTDEADATARLAAIAKDGWPTDPDLAIAPYASPSRAVAVAKSEKRGGKIVLVTQKTPFLTVGMFAVDLPDSTVLDAPAGTPPGKTFVVVVRAPVRDSHPPVWHVTRLVPSSPADATAAAQRMVRGF